MVLSFDKMRKRKDDVIEKLRGGIAFLLKQGKIDVYNGRGTAVTKNRIDIEKQDGSETIETKELIIATGSSPAIPPIPGSKRFNLTQVIRSLTSQIFLYLSSLLAGV